MNIGELRVHVTAYCPRDALGGLYCEFVLGRLKEILDNTTEADARAWLREHVADAGELFDLLDAGYALPVGDPFSIDPTNPIAELRIVQHLKREAEETAKWSSHLKSTP